MLSSISDAQIVEKIPRVPGLHHQTVRRELRWWHDLETNYLQPLLPLVRPTWLPWAAKPNPAPPRGLRARRASPPPRRGTWDPKGPRVLRPDQLSKDRPAVIDFSTRRNDVISIMKSDSVWKSCLAAGYDPEDLEQDVMMRVIARQSMPSRYDPERAGLAKYLTICTRGILLNLLERYRYHAKVNGIVGAYSNDGTECDAALIAVSSSYEMDEPTSEEEVYRLRGPSRRQDVPRQEPVRAAPAMPVLRRAGSKR